MLTLRHGEWYGVVLGDALITQLMTTQIKSKVHRKWRKVSNGAAA